MAHKAGAGCSGIVLLIGCIIVAAIELAQYCGLILF